MSGRWQALLDLLFGPRQPPAQPPVPPRTRDPLEAGIRIEYHGTPGAPPTPAQTLRWQRERVTGPRVAGQQWGRRITTRQRILLTLAAVALIAMCVAALAPLFTRHTLPPEVRGVWRTSAPAYASRRFELRRGQVAFLSGDSILPVSVDLVQRVHEHADRDGILFDVDLVHEGQASRFSFVYSAGPPEEIIFAHQRALVWRRTTDPRTLMPEAF